MLALVVGNNPYSIPDMRRTNCGSVYAMPHDNGMLTVIGDSKEPVVNIGGANNDYDIRTKSGIRCSLKNERAGINSVRMGTLSTAGVRGVKLQFTEAGSDRGSIYSNFGNGHLEFDNGFGPSNVYDFYVNGAKQHYLGDGKAHFTLQTFATNAAAISAGLVVGDLYKTSAGVVMMVI